MRALLLSVPAPLRPYLVPLFEAFVSEVEAAGDSPGGMGELESVLAREALEMQRLALERVAQIKADGVDSSQCPVCGYRLERVTEGHERMVRTRFGEVVLRRSKGYCPKCEHWKFPADDLLGLDRHAKASPAVQEASALLVSKMPATEAAKVAAHLLPGMRADDATMGREARRQGGRARKLRKKMDEQALSTTGRHEVTREVRRELGTEPFSLVIEMDAWLVRERDRWGEGEAARAADEKFSRWHWVYTATIFRLDQRGETQSGRPMILSRGYVSTREGLDSFSRQVYAEAVRQGLLIAQDTLVIADGGVWIWNIADERFPGARKRLDFYHLVQHIHLVAKELHGTDAEAARKWAEPLVHQLRHGGEAGVIQAVEDLASALEGSQRQAVEREGRYLRAHADHMGYEQAAENGEPIGSGAIESTCRQYQCRFKRPGQFWTTEGDESLLALETLWRNGRWHLLFPHTGEERLTCN